MRATTTTRARYNSWVMNTTLAENTQGNLAPIGVFDSGFGGLTVAHEITRALPQESIIYVGDSARCPYGPRSLAQVEGFVEQIGTWLMSQGVKLIVIACNTATAAGLQRARELFPVPVIGVIEPGARAAAHTTRNRRVGVIATRATIDSNAYTNAIRALDEEITVFATATPRFVDIAEQGIRLAEGPMEDYMSLASKVYVRPEFHHIAQEYLEPLRRCGIDTLVLGCTHFPLLKAMIGSTVGHQVTLISSATETARDVVRILEERGLSAPTDALSGAQGDALSGAHSGAQGDTRSGAQPCVQANAQPGAQAKYRFYTTGTDVREFKAFGSRVFCEPLEFVEHLDLV